VFRHVTGPSFNSLTDLAVTKSTAPFSEERNDTWSQAAEVERVACTATDPEARDPPRSKTLSGGAPGRGEYLCLQ
jgi:hypothetical protein